MIPVALTIAGSDPSGGAGLQADLKTFHRFGVYGEAVVTLITVQNTRGVTRVSTLDPSLVAAQIQAVLEDIPPQAAKVGALGSREIVEAVAREAGRFSFPLIVDPVMISKHGARLIDEAATRTLIEELIPRTFLLTPNLDEAAALTGLVVEDRDGMARAAEKLGVLRRSQRIGERRPPEGRCPGSAVSEQRRNPRIHRSARRDAPYSRLRMHLLGRYHR